MTSKKLQKLIRVARGEIPADLVLKGGQVVNVFSSTLQKTDVAVSGGRIAGLGSYLGRETIDCRGLFISPGFIDGHMHIESSLLTPANLAPVLLPSGTTSLVADPHEMANVKGLEGIRFMLQNSAGLPLEIFFMAPSCVPATPLETSGAILEAKDLRSLLRRQRILGLGEMMNFPGVLAKNREVLGKISAFRKKIKDGHAPLLSGKDLCAYVSTGIGSDHECTRISEAREKLDLGMRVMIRQGSQARNLKDLLPLVTPSNSRRLLFVSDDMHPEDLMEKGHLNSVIKEAVAQGLDPITALQMVTLNPAEYFGLSHLGAVAPGYQADLVVLKNLSSIEVKAVLKKGKKIAEKGLLTEKITPPGRRPSLSSMNIKGLHPDRFKIPLHGRRQAKVIQLIPDQILTHTRVCRVQGKSGGLHLDPGQDLSLVASVERHHGTGNIGLGLVSGLGLRRGALASSVAHDSHNIIVVGRDAEEMYLAVKTVEAMKGGLVVVTRGRVRARLPLPVAGLMSDHSAEEVRAEKKTLEKALLNSGCSHKHPFMILSFLALPVIPELRITDRGLVDVDHFQIVPLFEN
ncbi:MAG: adenine deaminase [Thermodesulfobacteriota bacterium]